VTRLRTIRAFAFATLLLAAPAAFAGSLVDLFREKSLAKLDLAPIGPALANTVASTYPVPSASSSVAYVYNPEVGTFERRTGVLGPVIGAERAETVGAGQIDVALSYAYVRLTTINGDDLSELVNRPLVGGRFIEVREPRGVVLKDGRITTFVPVQVTADLNVEAHIVTPEITYGITPDLDLNLTLPIIRTALDVSAATMPDQVHFPKFAVPPRDHTTGRLRTSASGAAEGVGDLLLRAKYVLARARPFDVAAGLGVAFPTGKVDDLQGVGTYRVQPQLIVSRVFADRFQPLLNVGIDLNAERVESSVVRWALGGMAQVSDQLTAGAAFLGRHELERQSEPIARPFFFQIERNDFYDASVGLRYRFAESWVLVTNAVVPLNRDGLRADVIPAVGVEYAFSAPWSSAR
jgi:hypothetical protein